MKIHEIDTKHIELEQNVEMFAVYMQMYIQSKC